jgi:hypothetical protein
MTTADGYLPTSAVLFSGSGLTENRWNLVILGDGFRHTKAAQSKFRGSVTRFVRKLKATEPYKSHWGAINVYRIDVVSTDSGADFASGCGVGPPVRTYYDATYCTNWNGTPLHRLLTVDIERAHADAVHFVPEVSQVLVMVNANNYGGSGGPLGAVFSLDYYGFNIAMHELGHSAFALGDEYEDAGPDTNVEPMHPNITLDSDPETIKWRDMIDFATTAIPTACNPACMDCADVPMLDEELFADGPVGLYEGAFYAACGHFRAGPACMMRDTTIPFFCKVCTATISGALGTHLLP